MEAWIQATEDQKDYIQINVRDQSGRAFTVLVKANDESTPRVNLRQLASDITEDIEKI